MNVATARLVCFAHFHSIMSYGILLRGSLVHVYSMFSYNKKANSLRDILKGQRGERDNTLRRFINVHVGLCEIKYLNSHYSLLLPLGVVWLVRKYCYNHEASLNTFKVSCLKSNQFYFQQVFKDFADSLRQELTHFTAVKRFLIRFLFLKLDLNCRKRLRRYSGTLLPSSGRQII